MEFQGMFKIIPFILAFLILSSPAYGQQPATEIPTTLPIKVADIMGRATLLVRPQLEGDLPQRLDGKSAVLQVLVDENGDVIFVQCSLTCPSDGVKAAERAASASKFRPLIVNGVAVRYVGNLTYSFAIERINWYRFGTALYSAYIFDNLSLGTVADILTVEYAAEKARLLELNNNRDMEFRWKTIREVQDALRGKLSERDKWEFDLGIAVRTVSAPFQSDRGAVREKVQKSLADLKKFADTAPPGTSDEMVKAIRTASEYVISPEVSYRDSIGQIYKLLGAIDPHPQPLRVPLETSPTN